MAMGVAMSMSFQEAWFKSCGKFGQNTMSSSPIFIIKCEGDCERISKVFIKWLQEDSPLLKSSPVLKASTPKWANIFASVYSDTVFNYDLTEKAENNVINVRFVDLKTKDDEVDDLDYEFGFEPPDPEEFRMSKEELNDLLDEFLDNMIPEEEDEDEDDA